MSTTEQNNPTATTAREVPADTLVIYADQVGQFLYQGPSSGAYAEIGIALGGNRPHTLRCDPALVAPADTAIPDKDSRVSIGKQVAYPSWQGPWLLLVPSADGTIEGTYHKTRRDGTATGLRALAILDWHKAAPASEPQQAAGR